MAKYLLEDMVRDKRDRQGLKPAKKVDKRVENNPDKKEEQPVKKKRPEPRAESSRKNKSRLMLWCVALISVGFCFFALSIFFGRAVVTINPKVEEISVNENLSAVKDSNEGLSFNLIIIDGTEDKTIQATEQKDVSERATGRIMIFNAFGPSPQTLSIDTRLEGSNGKIYKTKTKTAVPGVQKDGTPGSVEVEIYAGEAGEGYNSGPLDFKILGFKGTPKYEKFYGRSKTGTAISGGFVGSAPSISEADKAKAGTELKTALQDKLLKKAGNQIPSGFVLFKDAVFLNADESNISSAYKDDIMTLSLKGVLYGILFNEQKLTKKIAQGVLDKYDGSEVFIPNIHELSFTLADKDSISFWDIKNISFNLSGKTSIVWKVDEDKVVSGLLGKSKTYFKEILAPYKNIESANLALTPMWKSSVPEEAKNVKIIVNYPK
ncbi:MAG TPA: hypothetical protein VJH06_02345 [Candidatus Paceibacterota bacterium]